MHQHQHATPPRESPVMRHTGDATPSLAAAIHKLTSGHALDELVGGTVFGWARPQKAHGVSASWEGMQRIVERLTKLGCSVHLQVHADRCICEVLRVLEGAAVAKQLAVADGKALPETVAKAAVVACLEMQPQA
jgi:hypothetical protein